jgi:cytochrome c peroxidase
MYPTQELSTNQWIGIVTLLFTVGCCLPAWSQETTTFSRETLLKRFDANHDQRLDADERSVLRAAFGGIDIPLLPDEPHDYETVRIPKHIEQAELDKLDSTPVGNPITNAGATLGRVLFYDRHFSRNDTTSCATCHEQNAGFSDPRRFSRGFAGGHTGRNSMGLANLRYSNVNGLEPGFFWDERVATLEQQVLMPIQDEVEMGMTLAGLEKKLAKLPYYPALFSAAFGSNKVTSRRIARALAQFVRSIVSFDSTFDRSLAAATSEVTRGNSLESAESKLTEAEQHGRSLFMDGVDGVDEFACQMCHVPPTFNMNMSHNIGLDLKYLDRGLGALNRESNDPFTPSNDGKFKASSLRNVALSAPYMHDGRFKSLEQVVEHYSDGVHPHPNLTLAFAVRADNMKPTSGFGLSKPDQAALVAFLKTLTDESLAKDSRFSDPFIRVAK